MAEEEKELSLEERRRRLEERRKELEKKRAELRRIAQQARPEAPPQPPKAPPAPPPVSEKAPPRPVPSAAEKPKPVVPTEPPADVEPKPPVTPEVERRPPTPPIEPPKPAHPVVEERKPVPPPPPPIPPSPPPEPRGKGVLIVAVAVIVIAVAVLGYLFGTGKLGGGRPGGEPTEEELQAAQAQADSVARVQYERHLSETESILAAARGSGAEEDAAEQFELAVAMRDSAVQLWSAGQTATAAQLLRDSQEQAQEAQAVAEQVARDRRAEQARRDEALRAANELVLAAEESLATVEALDGRRYAARTLAQMDSTLRSATQYVDDGEASQARRSLARLPALMTEARDEIETARAEEEEVRRRLEQQRLQEEEETRRQEEEARRAAMESTPPQIVELASPVYPPLARAAGVQGTVVLDFLVDVDGSVKDVQVVDGPAALGEAARDALLRSTIRPATQGGQPVPARMEKRFTFRL